MGTGFDVVIVRYDEIALKSQYVRNRYERTLINNLRMLLDKSGARYTGITRERGRIFVHTMDERVIGLMPRVFGVVSVSPALTTSSRLVDVSGLAARLASAFIGDGESFAIRSRRAGSHSFTSRDVAVQCGDAILEEMRERGVYVDLTSPDHEIHVEVREGSAYLYTKIVQGTGGLPLGTQGKMIALLSGGIDSPVAAWLMMKRGCRIVFLHCNNQPFSDENTRGRSMECIKALEAWSPIGLKVYEAPNGGNLKAFLDCCEEKLACVLCKRMMYRIAIEIMKKEGAHGIVTGASLGQVASQTSQNLMAEAYRLNYPIYHPLIGLDKKEIIRIAEWIGTYTPSIGPGVCCTAVPDHPATRARINEVLRAEEKVGIEELLQQTLDRTRVVKP
ncbi:tRNA 4-thiouridine(8) synthase ThiI [Methanosarcinales archaeon ex4484_138]|nr:MAG: tRNA 4-thiouridine(8) synthase ThiI [Methanosarcinales archaeon ex4484_138]RLG27675.1 MAG: tRNA 4-thiouridine(8) synthase ThiI [Methanosarcinales archaeon]